MQKLAGLVPQEGAVRMRFPVQIYDEDRQQYTTLRETMWTLAIAKADLTPTTLQEILDTVDLVMRTLGTRGPEYIHEMLAGELPELP
jgi:hypothetical protein